MHWSELVPANFRIARHSPRTDFPQGTSRSFGLRFDKMRVKRQSDSRKLYTRPLIVTREEKSLAKP